MNHQMLSALFLNTTDDLIFLLRVKENVSYIFDSVNPAYLQHTGLTENIIGRSVRDVLPSDVVDFVISRFRDAMESRHHIKYEENVRFAGVPHILETKLFPFYDLSGNPEYLLGVARDITDKKIAELQFEESRQRYRSLFHNNPNVSFALDVTGNIVELNEVAEEVAGYKIEELCGTPFQLILHPKDHERVANSFAALLQGHPFNDEITIIHRLGHEVDLHILASPTVVNGNIIGAIGIARDITASKKANRLLRESEQRYRVLVQQSPDAIVIHDNGDIIFCNEAAARLVGAEHPDELLGQQVINYIHPDYRQRMKKGMNHVLKGEKAIPTFETKIVKNDGETVDVGVTTAFIEYNGTLVMQAVLRDITKRKLEEERLQKLSQMDGLTNIANRRYFDAVFAKEMKRAKRNQCPISLILFDIDFFKLYNDYYGHLTGDDCLKKIAALTASLIKRPVDLVARYGGEEFVVLLPETDLKGAIHVAERLRRKTEAANIPHAKSLVHDRLTISLGVASVIPTLHYQTSDLIEAADRALYEAKRNGKNRVVVSPD